MVLSKADETQLKAQLQDAVVACTERCLYHSAKWCVYPHSNDGVYGVLC